MEFYLFDKRTGDVVKIYAASEDSHGYPKFLIRKNNQWVWDSAKHYITEKERKHIGYTEYEKQEIKQCGELRDLTIIHLKGRLK